MTRTRSPQRMGTRGVLISTLQALSYATLLLSATAHADAMLDEARQLLESDRGTAAYDLLAGQLEQRAGDPDYDYLLALAALEADKPAHAVFALERVLAQRPDDGPALLALGRAHYLMGEDVAARHSFRRAAQQPLATAHRVTLDRYLSAIDRRAARSRHHITGHIELAAGHDSNINSATDDTTAYIPLYGVPVTLTNGSTSEDDNFLRLRGAVDYAGPLSAATRLLLGGRADLRRHDSYDEYDTDTFDVYAGVRWLQGRNSYGVTLQAQQFDVDGETNRELGSLSLQWNHTLDARNQLSAFLRHAAIRYPDQKSRDVDQNSLGATWSHAFDAPGKPLFYAGGYIGTDREQDSAHPEYGQKFYGVRVGGDYSLHEKLGLTGLLVWHDGKRDSNDPFFLKRRHDQILDLTLGLHYRFSDHISIQPQLHHTRNDSNISVYDYDRNQFQIALRYDFK